MADWVGFVGREEYLARIFAGGVHMGAFYDLRGISGAGKSVLMHEVERRAVAEHAAVLVDLKDYFSAFERDADESMGVREEAQRFCQAMTAILNGLRDRPSPLSDAVQDMLNEVGKLRSAVASEGM